MKENYKNYFENTYNKDTYKDYIIKDSILKKNHKITRIKLYKK